MPSNSKRARRGGGSPGAEPSKVVFVRNILPNTSEMEVQRSFELYGRVKCVFLIPKQHQALVEFSSIVEAEDLIRRQAEGESLLVRDEPVSISFSKQAKITDPRKIYLSHDPTNILLFTLFHVEVQVDCDTFLQICSNYGNVLKVCVTKTGPDTQAIVEFKSSSEAAEAKPNLNGADIYENCNTLRCEYVTELVYESLTNNPRVVLDEWSVEGGRKKQRELDEAGDIGDSQDNGHHQRNRRSQNSGPSGDRRRGRDRDRRRRDPPAASSLSKARDLDRRGPIGGALAGHSSRHRGRSPPASARGSDTNQVVSSLIGLANQLSEMRGIDSQAMMQYLAPLKQLARDRSRSLSRERDSGIERAPADSSSGCVVFLSGLSDKLNCDRLFNVLCLYGNVRLIKFFASNKNQAMAEMMDSTSARLCVQYLHHRLLLGRRLVVDIARQYYVKNVENFTNLPDGTPCIKDYAHERSLNRFLTADKMRKNHPVEPVSVLYFWGAPAESDEQDMMQLLDYNDAPKPESVQFLTGKEQARSGFLYFTDATDALDAVSLVNHIDIKRGGRVWLLKLAFSVANNRTEMNASSTGGGDSYRGGPRRDRGFKRRHNNNNY